LQQEGADLIDDAGALTDRSLTHAVQGLQIKLLGRLCRDELHSRALNCLGDRLGVAEVILLSLGLWTHVLRRHQASVVSEHLQLAAQMMRPNAGLHADETRRQVGQPCFHLPARPLLPKHDCTTFIVPHHVKRIFADIDTDHGDCRIELVWHGVLLVFGAPFQLPLLAGPEHGRTIPLADIHSLTLISPDYSFGCLRSLNGSVKFDSRSANSYLLARDSQRFSIL